MVNPEGHSGHEHDGHAHGAHGHGDNVFDASRASRLLSDERRAALDPDRLLDQLPIADGQRVLDVGCGPGFFLLPIAQRLPNGTAVGVDLQDEMLAMAKERIDDAGLANVELLQSSVEGGMPVPPAQADGALVSLVLHEATSHDAFMEAVADALRPDGWCLVIEWLKTSTESGPPQRIRISPWEVGAIGRKAGLAFQWSRQVSDRFSATLLRAQA